VANDQDPCPNQAGSAALQGCPDQDKDGLADKDDECPTLAGSIQSKGCPDADNDGVEDRVDKCPNTFGLANNSGCPEVKAEDKAILDFAMSNVNFETNSAKLLASSLEVLDKVADVLLRYPEFQIFIEGHTDDIGDAKANQRLSQNRVLACSNYLRNKGIPASSMNIQGFGESKPIADNKTKEGRKQNRRVEFRIEPW
jgi:outer membrane protein OmpA-like peptidoglycan-associated protein